LLAFSAIISSAFTLLSGCSSQPVRFKESKQELVAAAKDLWKYYCITIDNEAINREFGKWDDFVKEILKADYSISGGKDEIIPLRSAQDQNDGVRVSLIRKMDKSPKSAKEGGYYDDYENTLIIPYKIIFPIAELKETLRYALLDLRLETLSKIQKTRSAKVMREYKTLQERINPEHVDRFGDNFNEYSEDELRILITYMDEKYQDESPSIEYNLQFFQDALDHELGHFFLDDIEEGGLGLLYDKRYEGQTPGEILDYVYNRFKDSSFLNRLSEIYAPVTWCHTLEGYNPPNPPLLKGGIGGIKELIEFILKQRASYRLYVVGNYDYRGITWHVGTLRFHGIDEDEIPLSLTLPLEGGGKGGGELPPYFVSHNGQIFFNPIRKEIVSVGAGLPRPYTVAEIRQAEAYLTEYEAILLKQELFVRMVDALMSVNLKDSSDEIDFSETNYDLKPLLNEADLKMFERMKFMGKPMFQKATQKYRLGLQMLKSGYSPKEIRKRFEYATHCVYKGKEYF
ncbi:MAG TPA: hypothetical protein VI387_06610, partial [Candidatus Brocadiales bacterium]|nr:hypothetical protein [Candidatus Brocadiales bacterium]